MPSSTSGKSRYVVDTTVLVSAALFQHSKPGRALRWILEQGEVLLSPDTLEELHEVLGRSKFDRYLTAEVRERFIRALTERAVFIEPSDRVRICRDPGDDKFLELALSGGADAIVSGDADLIVLHPFRGILILSPDQFLARHIRQ